MEIVRLLSRHPDIQLNAVDHDQSKQTALHKVVQKLHDACTADEKSRYGQCLRILLAGSASINVNCQDAFGNTPVHYAALSGKYLLHF